jgi:hypothetical protein
MRPGNPKGWNFAHVDAMEHGRGNAGNRHWVPVNQHLLVHDILRASELPFPEVVREHNHGARSRRLVECHFPAADLEDGEVKTNPQRLDFRGRYRIS